MRIIVALAIVAAIVLIGLPLLIVAAHRRRQDRLRRRGIKSYNSTHRSARD